MSFRIKILLLVIVALSSGSAYFFFFRPASIINGIPVLNSLFSQSPSLAKGSVHHTKNAQLETALIAGLKELESSTPAIVHSDTNSVIEVSIPRGKPLPVVIWHLSSIADAASFKIIDCTSDPIGEKCQLIFKGQKTSDKKIIVLISITSAFFSKTAKMGILIDNFCFKADQISVSYVSFSESLTLSISPSENLAQRTAEIAHENKKEIVMQLPMEPLPASLNKSIEQSYCIRIDYSEQKIHRILDEAFESIPYCAGVVNFSGKRVLQDSRVMTILLGRLSKENRYFIELPLGQLSVAPAIAQKLKMPYGSIALAIEKKATPKKIRESIVLAAGLAQQRGSVILSSPATEEFIKVLSEDMPVLKKHGIHIVPVSTILSEEKSKF